MARPIRVQAPGLWHHVMSRGTARGAVFVDDSDREGFLELLVDVRERWGLRTHAACLMGNHFHLLVEDSQGLLARSMRHIIGLHTQRFNAREGRDGPLFRGRFRSRLVQHERYLAELVRYIHMNPVDAKLVEHAGDYRWSSHGHYLRSEAPPWLLTDEVMRRFDHDPAALDAFVHARLPPGQRKDLKWSTRPLMFGDAEFEATWRDRFRTQRARAASAAAGAQAQRPFSFDEVLGAVSTHYGLPASSVCKSRRGEPNVARQVAILVAVGHTALKAREIAAEFGLNARSLSTLATRYRQRLGADEALRDGVAAVLHALGADAPATRAS
jgi:putative transposase